MRQTTAFVLTAAIGCSLASMVAAVELDTGASRSTFITMADSDCAWDADDRVWDEANDMLIQLPDHAKHGAAAWDIAKDEYGLDVACDAALGIHNQYVKVRYE